MVGSTFLFSGCFWASNPEELDRLMKEDPAFKQMIVARDQINSQVRMIKNDMLAKKKVIDGQIDGFRREYDTYAKSENVKIEKYQTAMEANRNLLKRELETASAQLEAKETELGGYEKTLADVKKVLRESRGINLSAQEKQKWEERILLLSEKIRPVTEEIQDLRTQIRLKKRKIHFLQ